MKKTTDTPPGQADALRKPHRRRSVKEISGTQKQVVITTNVPNRNQTCPAGTTDDR